MQKAERMAANQHITITALTRYLKKKLESDRHLQGVLVRGEISNFKRHSRGHFYLTLKDEGARIQAVMFASNNAGLLFEPENGMKVLIQADLSVYESYGQYQLYIKEMQPDGIGNLFLAFEQLKKKLDQQGYFDTSHKKPMPAMPTEIGVVTSPTGAVIRDILTTVKRRFPLARITLFPVSVQGAYAAPSIVKAISQANSAGFLDVLIVGRGGGSLEELWAFNEESVAKAIYESVLPVVSAVGHETDVTISDFVADLRAATPTAAAELLVPNLLDLNTRIQEFKNRMTYVLKNFLKNHQNRLASLDNAYAFKYPSQLMRQKEQQLDTVLDKLNRAAQGHLNHAAHSFDKLQSRLLHHQPQRSIRTANQDRSLLEKRLHRAMKVKTEKLEQRFQSTLKQLDALSPLNIMARGYSLSYTAESTLIKSVKQVNPGDAVKIKVADGELDCNIWGIEED